MAVAYRSSAANASTTTTTSFTVVIPADVQDGDLLVLCVINRNGAGTDPTVVDDDTGGNTWTKFAGDANGKATIWRKFATSGTASKTITVSGCLDSSTGGVDAYSGADTTTPLTNLTTSANASGVESVSGFTPSFADEFICFAIFNHENNNVTDTQACTDPGVLTERYDAGSTGGSDCQVTSASRVQVGGPTATGNFTWNQVDGATITHAFAISPVQAASGWGRLLSGERNMAVV